MTNIRPLIFTLGILLSIHLPICGAQPIIKKEESSSLQSKVRSLDVYLAHVKAGEKHVMVVGAGHAYVKYHYPTNFYLVDSNRSMNVHPDLVANVTQPFPNEVFGKFDVIIFEYVAIDVLTPTAFENAFKSLKEEGIFLFDTPGDYYVKSMDDLKTKEGGKLHNTQHGQIFTFFDIGNLDIYVSDVNSEMLKKSAMELLLSHLEGLLRHAGFIEISYVEKITESPYDQYIKSENKYSLSQFTLSAKRK